MFKDLFKSKEQREQEARVLAESIAKAERERLLEEQRQQLETEARIRREIEENRIKERMESNTPWYEPIIGSEDATFVYEKYRWNPAFIKDLLKKGHRGETDNEVFTSFLIRQEEDERQRILDEERDKKRNSSEPWVEVIGEHIDDEGRIEIQLDWNDAFIKYLRRNNFRGATDDILVQAWLAALEKERDPEEFH